MVGTGSGEPRLVRTDGGVIETTYGCVVVRAVDSEPLVAAAPAENTLVDVPEGGHDGDLLVQGADQWGPFSVTTRLWDGEPGDPGPQWEDVVELSVTVPTGLGVTELVDNEPWIDLVDEPGQYRLRVSARGRRVPDRAQGDAAFRRHMLFRAD